MVVVVVVVFNAANLVSTEGKEARSPGPREKGMEQGWKLGE